MALGLEPGRTVTLQTDRHSWGSWGDHPLPPVGHQGGWRDLCPAAVWEKSSFCISMWGAVPARGSLPAWPEAERSTGAQWRNMHLLLHPPSPLHPGCTARSTREGTAQTALPFLGAGAAITLPSASCTGEGHRTASSPCIIYMCVWWGEHRETASPPPVPVMRTGCTGAPIPVTTGGTLCKLTALGLHNTPSPLHGESPQESVQRSRLLAPQPPPGQNGGPVRGEHSGLPGCAALRPTPAAVVPGRAGRRLCGEWKARGDLDSTGAGAELSWQHGAGVVVGVGVAAGQAGGQRGDGTVAGAPVLHQDVDALLAAGSPGVGQRGQPPSVPALHVHPILCRRESSWSVAPRRHAAHGHEAGVARAPAERLRGTGARRERETGGWAGQSQQAHGGTCARGTDKGCLKTWERAGAAVGKHRDRARNAVVEAAGSCLTQMSSCVKTTLAMAQERCSAVRPSPSP